MLLNFIWWQLAVTALLSYCFPFNAAKWSGVLFSRSFWQTLVMEALVRTSTWRAIPFSAAMCNGVFPELSLSREFAFLSSKTFRSWKISKKFSLKPRSMSYFHPGRHSGHGRRGGLMVSVLDSRASGPGSSPDQGNCVVFLGKTLYSHNFSTQVYK